VNRCGLGVLTPLTGAGAFDGPRMLRRCILVAADINAAVIARTQVELVVEDDETNPGSGGARGAGSW